MSNPWKMVSTAMLNDGLKELRKCAQGVANFQLLPGEAECILHEFTRLRQQQPNRVLVKIDGQNRISVHAERPGEVFVFVHHHSYKVGLGPDSIARLCAIEGEIGAGT